MGEPASLANSQFCSLGSYNYNKVLSDDYCHKKLETVKVKGSTTKNASFNLKTTVLLKKTESGSKLALTDEYKFGFPYERLYLQTRVKRNGDLKLHLDGGEIEVLKTKVNLFTNLKTNLSFGCYNWRVGFNYFGERCESNLRIETNSKQDYDFANRTILKNGNWRYGLVSIFHLDGTALKKYDSFVEYRKKDYELHLSHLSPAVTNQGMHLGKLTLGGLYRLNPSTNVALQVKKNCAFPKLRAVLGVQKAFESGLVVRGKCDTKGKISTVGKYKVNPKLTLSFGSQFNLEKGSKFIDFSQTLPFPLGFGVDIEA